MRKETTRHTQDLPSNSKACVAIVESLDTLQETVPKRTRIEMEEGTSTIVEEDMEEAEEDFKEEVMEGTTIVGKQWTTKD